VWVGLSAFPYLCVGDDPDMIKDVELGSGGRFNVPSVFLKMPCLRFVGFVPSDFALCLKPSNKQKIMIFRIIC